MPNISIRELKTRYSGDKKTFDKKNPFAYFVLRRLSFYLTWICVRLGLSANEVSFIGLISGCIGCLFFTFGSYTLTIIGALMVNIYCLLDYVDGNIARYNDSCSKFGSFIDSANGLIVGVLLFISIGIGLFTHPDPSLNSISVALLHSEVEPRLYLLLGGLASSMSVLGYSIASGLSREVFGVKRLEVSLRPNGVLGRCFDVLYRANHVIASNRMPIALFAAIFGFLSLYVFIFAIIYVAAFVALLISIISIGRKYETSQR